jgi:hypothetical protein
MSLTEVVNGFVNPFGSAGSSGNGTTNGSLSLPTTDLGQLDSVGLNDVFQRYGKLRPGLNEGDVNRLAAQRGEAEAQVTIAQAVSREAAGLARARLALARVHVGHQKQMMGTHQAAADLANSMTQANSRYRIAMGAKQEFVDGWTRIVDTQAQRVANW